jgi:GH24 family phage-related lysozyme (muramidase)
MAKEWVPYTLSPAGRAFLLGEEDNLPFIYDDRTSRQIFRWSDVKGYPTVGMGVKIEYPERPAYDRWMGKTIPADVLAEINEDKLQKYLRILNRVLEEEKFPGADEDVHVNDGAFYVLFSYMWNTGHNSTWFKRLLNIYKTGDVQAASDFIRNGPKTAKGVLNRGLVKRRNSEADELLKHVILNRRPFVDEKAVGFALPILIAVVALGFTTQFAYRRYKKYKNERASLVPA